MKLNTLKIFAASLSMAVIAGLLVMLAAVQAQAAIVDHSCEGMSTKYGDVIVDVHPMGSSKKVDAVVVITTRDAAGEERELAYPSRKTLEIDPFKFQYTSGKAGGFKLQLFEENIRTYERKGRLWVGQWKESVELECRTYASHD